MNDVSLITVNDLKTITSISKNISTDILEPYILISEEFYVYNILGDALLTELKNQLTGNTLSLKNQNLIQHYIKPLAAYGAWFEASPFLSYKTVEKGLIKQHSNNSDNLSLEELAFFRQSLKDKVSFFETRLTEFLDKNKDTYPLYRSSCNNTDNNSTGIYLGSSLC